MTTLADPMELRRGPVWGSRAALAPMTNRQSNDDGTLGEAELSWLRSRAAGGFGLILTCAAHIRPDGQGWAGELGVWDESQIAGLSRLSGVIRDAGAVSSVQLHHGGLRADRSIVTDRVAPWDDAKTGARALRADEIEELAVSFGRAAARAEAAGFDGVEVHGAHGYLIGQFLDSERNHRADGYGGSFAGRTRFLREVLTQVREATSDGFQVGLRLSPERWGIALAESKTLASEMLVSDELDYLDMSLWDVFKKPEPHDGIESDKTLLEHFVELQRGTTRLGVAGKIRSSRHAQWCLDAGVDFVSIGTAAILHHDFANRAIADDRFESLPEPVDADYLNSQAVSSTFVEYLREIRPHLVQNAIPSEKDLS